MTIGGALLHVSRVPKDIFKQIKSVKTALQLAAFAIAAVVLLLEAKIKGSFQLDTRAFGILAFSLTVVVGCAFVPTMAQKDRKFAILCLVFLSGLFITILALAVQEYHDLVSKKNEQASRSKERPAPQTNIVKAPEQHGADISRPSPPVVLTNAPDNQPHFGNITSPFISTNGYIYQPIQTGVADGGTAIYTFTITHAGNYVVQCLVSATNEGMNSFYVNIDSLPIDPSNIWNIPLTVGFQEEVVSAQGTGTYDAPQFSPAVFALTNGTHRLYIVGREANTKLQSISMLQMVAPPRHLQVYSNIINGPIFPITGQ